jgi:hypothetical protein
MGFDFQSMSRIFLIFLFASCSHPSKENDFKAIFSKPTAWFASNRDSIFFTSDSITLIQYSNTYGDRHYFLEDAVSFFDSSDIVRIILRQDADLSLDIFSPKKNSANKFIGKYSWKYDATRNIIQLCQDGKNIFCFQPIREHPIQIKTLLPGVMESVRTTSMLVKRIPVE